MSSGEDESRLVWIHINSVRLVRLYFSEIRDRTEGK